MKLTLDIVFESFHNRDLKDTGSCDEPGAGAPLVPLHRGEPLGRVLRKKVQTSQKHTQREGLYALSIRSRTPRRSTPGSVGYDVFTPIDFILKPQEQKTVFVDLATTPLEGYYTQLMSKSGLAVLYEIEVKAGVIDPDYTGNIGVVLKNNSQDLFERAIGEPIAQLLFIKVVTPKFVQVQNLTPTKRGGDGFGTHSAISTLV